MRIAFKRITLFALPSLTALCIAASPRNDLFTEVFSIITDNFAGRRSSDISLEEIKSRYEPLIRAAAGNEPLFSASVNNMLSDLKTSHTRYYTTDDPEYYYYLDIFKSYPPINVFIKKRFSSAKVIFPGIGILTRTTDHGAFISSVFNGSPADTSGLKRGDRIISVDGKSFSPVSSFRGKIGKKVIIRIKRHGDSDDDTSISVIPSACDPGAVMYDAMNGSARIIQRGSRRIGYIHIWSFADERYFECLIEHINTTFRTADALIVDLRDGFGGADPSYLNVFNTRIPVIRSVTGDGIESTYDPQWRKPVILMINGGTRSGKEVFAYGFRKYGYGRIVGTTSAGAVAGGRPYILSNGNMLYLAVTKCFIDGESIEGKGIHPDIVVEDPLEYSGRNDPQLETAISAATEDEDRR